MYTTPLSTLISSLSLYCNTTSLYHYFYADTQLFHYFIPWLSRKHHSPPECSHTDHVLDDFESLIIQFL